MEQIYAHNTLLCVFTAFNKVQQNPARDTLPVYRTARRFYSLPQKISCPQAGLHNKISPDGDQFTKTDIVYGRRD